MTKVINAESFSFSLEWRLEPGKKLICNPSYLNLLFYCVVLKCPVFCQYSNKDEPFVASESGWPISSVSKSFYGFYHILCFNLQPRRISRTLKKYFNRRIYIPVTYKVFWSLTSAYTSNINVKLFIQRIKY